MKDAPILPALDLWSQGYSAADIAELLGFPNHRHIQRIVANAREIGDQRAVYHRQGWRLQGKGIPARDRDVNPLQKTYRGLKIVPVLTKQPLAVCRRGHPRTEDNLAADGRTCVKCRKLTDRSRYSAIKGLR